jgi:hypothetical protein
MSKYTVTRQDDVVWITKEHKYHGICETIQKNIDTYFIVFVIANFEKTLDELKGTFDVNGLPHRSYKTNWDSFNLDLGTLENEKCKIFMLLSELVSILKEPNTALSNGVRERRTHIIVAEHYPIPKKDRDILSFAERLPYFTTVCFHTSLDEPLMKIFCGKGFATTLKNFGLDETKPVSGPMVTSAISSVQKKVMHMAIADEKVSSMEEWFYYNCPKIRKQIA